MIFKFKKNDTNAIEREIKTSKCLDDSTNSSNINITELNDGETAKVIELNNNIFARKLEAIGIVPGSIITKKSSSLSKGPIILKKGQLQFAIGYEIAQKIIVESVDFEGSPDI